VATLILLRSIWYGALFGLGEALKDAQTKNGPINFIVKTREKEIIKTLQKALSECIGQFWLMENISNP